MSTPHPGPLPRAEREKTHLTTGCCAQCLGMFEYERKLRAGNPATRTRCDRCRRENNSVAKARRMDELRVKHGEQRASAAGGLHALALRTEAETGAILGIDQQKVNYATRSALVRVRKLLRADNGDLRSSSLQSDNGDSRRSDNGDSRSSSLQRSSISFHEMETDLRDWRVALGAVTEESLEYSDPEMAQAAAELAAQIESFATVLQEGIEGQRHQTKTKWGLAELVPPITAKNQKEK